MSPVMFVDDAPRTIKVDLGSAHDFAGDNFNVEMPTFGGFDSLTVTRGTDGIDFALPDSDLLEGFQRKLQNSSVSGVFLDPNTELAPPTLADSTRNEESVDIGSMSYEEFMRDLNARIEKSDWHTADLPGSEPNTVLATLPVEGVGILEIRNDGTIVSDADTVGSEPVIGIDPGADDDHTSSPLAFGDIKSRYPFTSRDTSPMGEIMEMYPDPPPFFPPAPHSTSQTAEDIPDNPYMAPELIMQALEYRGRSGSPELHLQLLEAMRRAEGLREPQPGEFLGDEEAPVYTEETRWVGNPDTIEEPSIEEDPDADRFIS